MNAKSEELIAAEKEIVTLTRKLLESISCGDWKAYREYCDHSLTCFEPEARGHLVHGMAFHRFYFDNLSHNGALTTTIIDPDVRFLGNDVAIIAYVRLQQRMTREDHPETIRSEETRVWHKLNDKWQHVHFHRSTPS